MISLEAIHKEDITLDLFAFSKPKNLKNDKQIKSVYKNKSLTK